ncbi:MAG: hypothetical protein ACTTJC_02935 [Campylobacter sp.]
MAENPNSSYYFVTLWIGIIVISWILGIIRKRKNRQHLYMLVKQKHEDKIEMMAEAMRRSGIRNGINIKNLLTSLAIVIIRILSCNKPIS